MEVSFPKIGTIMLTVLSFITISDGTFIGNFLRWMTFGLLDSVFDFMITYYPPLASTCFVIIFLKWIKNAYWLAFIWLIFFLIIYYGLRSVGVA